MTEEVMLTAIATEVPDTVAPLLGVFSTTALVDEFVVA
jgi:hypothetical protein